MITICRVNNVENQNSEQTTYLTTLSCTYSYSVHDDQNEIKKERKPFNLEEELKKPYIVGIKAE